MSTPNTLQDAQIALDDAQRTIAALREALESVTAPPHAYGVVIRLDPYGVTIRSEKGTVIAPTPADTELLALLKPGVQLLFAAESGVITQVIQPLGAGNIATVVAACEDDMGKVEVSLNGQTLRVFVNLDAEAPLKAGAEVVLDSTSSVIVYRIPTRQPPQVPDEARVEWDAITGHVEAKRILREIIEAPHTHPELYGAYKKRATKGVLLYGPPGCGKTMLGKAAATAIQGAGAVSGFIYVKSTDLLNAFVGESERLVRALFEKARHHKRDHGTAAVIFVDEADAILGVRGGMHAMMEKTIVPAFLTEMDGMDASAAVVILATNRPDTLDPAVIREGRIDRKILVGRPLRDEVEHLTQSYLSKVPLSDDFDIEEASIVMGQLMFSDGGKPSTLGKQVSGSLIAGVVDRAASAAFQRDMANGATAPTGVSREDLGAAINMVTAEIQNANTNHLAT